MPLPFTLCLFGLAFTSSDVKVTLQATESVTALLKDLSARTGTGLSVSAQRGKEILIVSLEDAPLAEALSRIAWATYGRWEKGSNGLRLVRDSDAEKEAERKYVAWHRGEIANAIDVCRNRILKEGRAPEPDKGWTWPQETARQGVLARAMDRALAQALSEVRPETLAFTHIGTPYVYSDRPTASQLAFRDGGSEVLRIYNKGPKVSGDREAAHVLLKCDYRFGSGTVRLNFYDEQGRPLDFVRATIRPDAKHRPTSASELADEIPEKVEVPLSQASQAFLRIASLNPFDPFGDPMRQAPDLMRQLQNPERFEPMATFATDAWLAVAKWKRRSLVANVDDAYMFPYWASTLPKLREAFRTAGGYNAEVQAGWIVARPSLANPPWQHRVDRESLGLLARRQMPQGLQGLFAKASFAGASTAPPDPWATRMYLMYAGGQYVPDLGEDWQFPRLMGTITDLQRAEWVRGGRVPLRELPEAARVALGEFTTPKYDAVPLENEATVRYPGGASQEGFLQGKPNSWDLCYFRLADEKGKPQEYVQSLRDFGAFLNDEETKRPNLYAQLSVRLARSHWMELVVVLGENRSLSLGNFELPMEEQKEYVPWSQMPLDVRQRILGRSVMNLQP